MRKILFEEIQRLAKELENVDINYNSKHIKNAIAKLYEKIIVLDYLENQIEGSTQVERETTAQAFDSKSFREQNWFTEPVPIPRPEHKEDLVEPLMEKIKDLVAQMPPESQRIDAILEEVLPEKRYIKNELEDFAKEYQQMPTFERKTSKKASTNSLEEKHPTKGVEPPKKTNRLIDDLGVSEKPKSINDTLNKGLTIGLNDRLAYIKHLFEGDANSYSRVLSQINTLQSYEDVVKFIDLKVRPEYQHWDKKEEYVERFLLAFEKQFD